MKMRSQLRRFDPEPSPTAKSRQHQQNQQQQQQQQQRFQRQSLSPRDPSGRRVTQQGARLIEDEVTSLTIVGGGRTVAAAAGGNGNGNGNDDGRSTIAGGNKTNSGTASPIPQQTLPKDRVMSADTLDGLVRRVDLRADDENDKYRSVVAAVLSPIDQEEEDDLLGGGGTGTGTGPTGGPTRTTGGLTGNLDVGALSDPSSATGTMFTASTNEGTLMTTNDEGDATFDEEYGNTNDDEYDYDDDDDYDEEYDTDDAEQRLARAMSRVRSLTPCEIPPSASPVMSTLTTPPPFLHKQSLHQKQKQQLQQQQQQHQQRHRSAGATILSSSTLAHANTTTATSAKDDTSRRPAAKSSLSAAAAAASSPSTFKRQSSFKKNSKSRNASSSTNHNNNNNQSAGIYRNNTLNTMESGGTMDVYHIFSDDDLLSDYWKTKQKTPYLSLIVTAVQVLVLMLQLTLCGVAPLNINPMVGPFPDAFSEWGGKNPYLMMVRYQYWRLVSPAALHVGVLHLLLNAYCQLDTCAYLEREWASGRWMLIYIGSEVGCILVSSANQPDTFAVGSTGALMGLLGAKLAQALSHVMFDIRKTEYSIRLEQMSGVLCSLAVLSMLSFVTYIDWSGHVGGLGTGFLMGMMLFCKPIEDVPSRVVWCLMGMIGIGMGAYAFGRALWDQMDDLDAELADPCNYFRRLFPEGYDCECLWGV